MIRAHEDMIYLDGRNIVAIVQIRLGDVPVSHVFLEGGEEFHVEHDTIEEREAYANWWLGIDNEDGHKR